MSSEKGGDAATFDFRFDNQSQRSVQSNQRNQKIGGLGSASEDSGLTELMVMHKAAEAIRQEYIEEPSFRKSMFAAPQEDISVTRIADLPLTSSLILMVVAWIAFGIVTICFKAVYLNYRHTIWEDIYGRSIGFFICSSL